MRSRPMLTASQRIDALRDSMAESSFQETVIQFARLHRFQVYHTHDSRRSRAGFPDLTLWKPGRLIFAELKAAKGRLAPAQGETLVSLRDAGVEVYLWRPEDWPEIERVLGGRDDEAQAAVRRPQPKTPGTTDAHAPVEAQAATHGPVAARSSARAGGR